MSVACRPVKTVAVLIVYALRRGEQTVKLENGGE